MANDNIDDIIEQTGGCGRFQVIFGMATLLVELPLVWSMMMMVFGGYSPGMQCVYNDLNGSSTGFTMDNENGDPNEQSAVTGSTVGNAETFNIIDGYKNLSLSMVNGTSMEWTCDHVRAKTRCPGTIKFKDGASTIVTEWDLVCDRAWISSVIISLQMMGVLLGHNVGGAVATKFGRKVAIYGHLALCAMVNTIAIFSSSWIMFAVVRFFIGMTFGGLISTSFSYTAEFLNNKWRGYFGCIPDWTINYLFFTVAVVVLKDWRHIHIATAVAAGLCFLPVFWVPESIRWLAVHGKMEKATLAVRTMASMNGTPMPKTDIFITISKGKEDSESHQESVRRYRDLFRGHLLKPTIVLGFSFFSMSIAYFAIEFGIKAFFGNYYTNLLAMPLTTLPCYPIGMVLVNRIGRRRVSICFLGIGALAALSITILHFAISNDDDVGLAIIVLAITCNAFVLVAWGVLQSWVVELYPTTIRTFAFAWVYTMSRVSGMIVPYIIPKNLIPLFATFIIVGIVLCLATVCLWTLPETMKRTLRDTTVDCELFSARETNSVSVQSSTTKNKLLPATNSDVRTQINA